MQFGKVLKGGLLAGLMAMAMSGSAFAVTLHMHNGGDPSSLDPHRVSGTWENRIVGDYLEGLTTEDAEAEAIPGAAESWDISDDGLVYTFHLRPDGVWSDGEPLTAHDFVFAFQRLMDPETAARYAYLQFNILNAAAINAGEIEDVEELGVVALDDYTLEITLENPAPFLLQALTHYTAYPVPRHKVDELGDAWTEVANIVGNGPYLPVEWLPGAHVRSVKNDLYHDAANVQIDEVVYYALDDLGAALNRFRAGEFDILTDFPADQVSLLEQQYPGQAFVAPFLGLHYYVFNLNNPDLADADVRKALSMAINRELIGPDIFGTGELPAYSWVPPGTANYDGAEFRYEWADTDYGERVAEAQALLEAAGYGPGNPLELQIRYNTSDNHQRLAVAIAAMWEQLGVTTELFNLEVNAHYDGLMENDFHSVGRAGWVMDFNDPVNMLDLLRSDIEYNYGRYDSAEYDALLVEAAAETDIDARAALLAEAETLAMEEYAALPLAFYVSRNVVAPHVTGFIANAKDVNRTRWLTKSEN